jgi:hypothetical protein
MSFANYVVYIVNISNWVDEFLKQNQIIPSFVGNAFNSTLGDVTFKRYSFDGLPFYQFTIISAKRDPVSIFPSYANFATIYFNDDHDVALPYKNKQELHAILAQKINPPKPTVITSHAELWARIYELACEVQRTHDARLTSSGSTRGSPATGAPSR